MNVAQLPLIIQSFFLYLSYVTGVFGAYTLIAQMHNHLYMGELTPLALRTIAIFFLSLLLFCWSYA